MTDEYTVTVTEDRPKGGMWHTGPNPCWVTVKHHPTGIMARAYHARQYAARDAAMCAVNNMRAILDETPKYLEALNP